MWTGSSLSSTANAVTHLTNDGLGWLQTDETQRQFGSPPLLERQPRFFGLANRTNTDSSNSHAGPGPFVRRLARAVLNARQTRLFELLPADQILSTWHSHGPARWTAEDDGTVRCQNAAADQPGYSISGATYTACEFHVDVYLHSPSAECRLGLFDQATDDLLSGYVLHVSLPDTGSGGLAHSSDGWIAALDPAAQRQLRTGYWNDVRLHYAPGQITAHQRLESGRHSHSKAGHAPGAHSVGRSQHALGRSLAQHTSARTGPRPLRSTSSAMQAILIASTLTLGLASSDSSDGAAPALAETSAVVASLSVSPRLCENNLNQRTRMPAM